MTEASNPGPPRRVSRVAIRALTTAVTAATVAVTASTTYGLTPVLAAQQKPAVGPEAGMTAGRTFADPPDAATNPTRHLTITLDAASTRFDLAGRRVFGESYNASFVAPTLHLAPGDHVTITLVNHLKVATNLHFHGLHVSPSNDADNSFLCIAPGHTFDYQLNIPNDHPLGTFWYHAHPMGTTCSMTGMGTGSTSGDVENQIFAGLSGALIVGDDRTLLPPALRHITVHTLVLKDAQIDGAGHILQNAGGTTISSNAPTARLVNGQLRPVLTLRPGQTQLWRLVNAGADIFYRLRLDGYHFTVIGTDGRPVARVTTPTTLLLPPGKRYDVLVTAATRPGHAWLRTTAYSNGPAGDSYPDVPLADIRIAGHPLAPLTAVPVTIPTAPPNLAGASIARHRTLVLTENSAGTTFFINGRQFSMNTSIFTTPAVLGTVEEWTVTNQTGEDHPFHLHTNAFQVMSINGKPQPYLGRQDIALVPHKVNNIPGRIVLRIPFADYTGRWMFHCHIAAHEDNGMMNYINVVS